MLDSRYILQKEAVLNTSFVQKFSTGLVVNQIAWLASCLRVSKSNCFDKDKAIILGPKAKATGHYIKSYAGSSEMSMSLDGGNKSLAGPLQSQSVSLCVTRVLFL